MLIIMIKNLSLSLNEMLYFRNHLALLIIWGNASREGELKNVTIKDYQCWTIRDNYLAIPVKYHIHNDNEFVVNYVIHYIYFNKYPFFILCHLSHVT